MFRDWYAGYCTLSHLLRLPPGHPVGLLGVGVEVVQPGHPDATDRAHVRLLPRVDPLVDPELPLVVELLITESTLMQELAPVFVFAVFPLAPVLVPGPAD